MSEHAAHRLQRVNRTEVASKDAAFFQRRNTNQSELATLSERLFDADSGTFVEPRLGCDFSRVPAHTDMVQRTQPLLRTKTRVQRSPRNQAEGSAPCATCSDEEPTPISALAEPTPEATSPAPESTPTPMTAEPEAESAALEETTAPALLVEDSTTELAPGQMRKNEFLAQLRIEVNRAAEAAMVGTGRTTADCPYLNYWFGYYSLQDSAHIERAIHRYAPETENATTVSGYIPIIAGRVRRAVETWARTGEITGVPEGIPTSLPGASPAGGEGGAEASTGTVMFKAREGGAKVVENPRAVQAELGEGRALDSGVRSRMESAFGMDFSYVRTHTDPTAARLSNELNARAFTVGEHIAFGAGEYRPGTLIGDSLIAHEMAHVVQQSGSSASVAHMELGNTSDDALESDADKSAVGVMVSLLGGAKGTLNKILKNAIPQLRSGLRLQRCSRDRQEQRNSKGCCCCIEDIDITSVSKISSGRLYGHSFDTEFSLKYLKSENNSDCKLIWNERTNRGYTSRMRAANNVWYDMTQDPEASASFAASWGSRKKPCPGMETIKDTDPPQASLDLPARTLEFRIKVESGDGCKCNNASKCITAIQTLEPTTDAPPKIKTQRFEEPNPSDSC